MRVVHLVDASDAALRLSLADAADADPATDHAVWVVGPGRSSIGPREAVLPRTLCGRPRNPLSMASLGFHLRRSGATVVHNWLRVRVPKLLLPPGAKRVWTPGGRDREHLLDPAINPARIERGERDAMRMRWGVTDPNARVVAALGEGPRTDALLAMLAVGLAAETGRPIQLLISPRARGLHRARRVVQGANRGRLMVIDEAIDRPWEVLAGCDLMLAGEPSVARGWGLAAGLPDVQQLCEDRLAEHAKREAEAIDGDPARVIRGSAWAGELARVIRHLFDHPEESAAAGEASRREAEHRYAPSRIARHLAALYRQ